MNRSQFFISVLCAGILAAQSPPSPGTFTSTGDMSTPRVYHTATLLTNGKVLIVGGSGPYSPTLPPLASAELYDPSSGTFSATGGMATSRLDHTATLLPNGKVLIAGGAHDISNFWYPVASAELYDPSSGTFTATGSMATSRLNHTATLLPNGKVLIAGGACDIFPDGSCSPVASEAELYDSSTGTFTGIGNLDDGNYRPYNGGYQPSTTLLADGRVLIVGASAHLYDPGTGGLSDPIFDNYLGLYFNQKGTLLMNGRVLFAGYDDDEGDFWGPELFDPSGEVFTTIGNMIGRRADHTATLLPDGTVLIAGRGWLVSGNTEFFYSTVTSAELYDPVTGTFSNTGNMATDRDAQTATLLNDGRVLITGGRIFQPPPSYGTVVLSSAEIYHPGVLVPAPVLLSLSGDGKGQGAIQHASTYQVVSADNPAAAGEILVIYSTGFADGSMIPPQVAIGGRMAEVLWFGNTPGYVGLSQINASVPEGVASGSAVPVRITYLSRPSNEVTIAVR
jgi:Galactose oxidase, central domain